MTLLVIGIFVAVYAGMALGRWPGLRIDPVTLLSLAVSSGWLAWVG